MNNELIERAKARRRDGPVIGDFTLWDDIITALESQPFDVLQHLRDGGKVRRKSWYEGNFLTLAGDDCLVNQKDETRDSFAAFILFNDDWHPYHEPPAEGSREWAMAQDGRVTHENITAVSILPEFVGDFMSAYFDTGWSLWTREPGWYSAALISIPDVYYPWKWTGEHWDNDAGNQLMDDSFIWIGKTRIELETPES